MAKNNRPDVYKGRRKKLNVLGIVLSALAVLIVAAKAGSAEITPRRLSPERRVRPPWSRRSWR